jgi:hypothetical protein
VKELFTLHVVRGGRVLFGARPNQQRGQIEFLRLPHGAKDLIHTRRCKRNDVSMDGHQNDCLSHPRSSEMFIGEPKQ